MSLRKEDALCLYLDDPSSQSRIREKGVDLKLNASCLSHPKVSPWHYHAPNRKSTRQEFEDGGHLSAGGRYSEHLPKTHRRYPIVPRRK
jgi:hypothetical protein